MTRYKCGSACFTLVQTVSISSSVALSMAWPDAAKACSTDSEATLELVVGALQDHLRVTIGVPRQIGDGKKQIADLLLDVAFLFFRDRLLDLGGLFPDLVQHQHRILPVKTNPCRLLLKPPRARREPAAW